MAAGQRVGRVVDCASVERGGGTRPGSPGAAASGAPPSARAPRSSVPAASAAPEPPTPRDDPQSQHEVAVSSEERELRRGARFHVTGNARTEQGVCANSRVDIALRDKAGAEHWLGALATDQDGKYDGRVALPFELEVGDYSVIASTPRSAQCGGGGALVEAPKRRATFRRRTAPRVAGARRLAPQPGESRVARHPRSGHARRGARR